MIKLNPQLIELIDIEDINYDGCHINMVDISVEDDETFILENGIISHNSAKSSLREVRTADTMGMMPLRGKVNNVYGATIAEILKMGKVENLFAAMGLIPGKKADRLTMRFSKMIISTDADPDGSDIFSLLINMFYTLWPNLFDPKNPFVYRLVVPNICAVKGKKRVHFINRLEYESVREQYKGWEILHYKGLGSMERDDWKMIMDDLENFLLPIVDDGVMPDALELLFSENAAARKDWLRGD